MSDKATKELKGVLCVYPTDDKFWKWEMTVDHKFTVRETLENPYLKKRYAAEAGHRAAVELGITIDRGI